MLHYSFTIDSYSCPLWLTVSVGSFVTELSAPLDGLLQEKIQGLFKGGNYGLRYPDFQQQAALWPTASRAISSPKVTGRLLNKQSDRRRRRHKDPQTLQSYDTVTTMKTQLPFTVSYAGLGQIMFSNTSQPLSFHALSTRSQHRGYSDGLPQSVLKQTLSFNWLKLSALTVYLMWSICKCYLF